MRSFAVDFVAETNLRALSVKDVKDAIGEALGGVGVAFIPQVCAFSQSSQTGIPDCHVCLDSRASLVEVFIHIVQPT